MVQRSRAQRLNGLFPLSYVGVNPVSPINFIMDDRAPTINDSKNFYIGDLWLDTSTQPPSPQNLWMLTSLVGNNATWVNFDAGAGDLDSLTGDTGGPVQPDGVGNINIISNIPGLTVDGNPGTNTLVLNIAGGGQLITTLTGNSGGPVGPSGIGNINVVGDLTTIDVVGTPGTNTLTISALGILATEYDANIGSATPSLGVLRILGGIGTTTVAAGNTITINSAASVATSYITSPATGTATPAANVLTFAGGGGTTVSAAGSTITITSSGGGGGGSGAGGTIVTEYDGAGAGNHTLNTDTEHVAIIAWAGGSGGGSGRQGADTAAGGGSGGGAGAFLTYQAPVVFFGGAGAIVAYAVGAGGAGGAPQAAANTDGNDGTAGGVTSFGNVTTSVYVSGGDPFGAGGANGGTSGGTFTACYDNATFNSLLITGASNSGGDGNLAAGTNGASLVEGTSYPSGGGGGGGANTGTERAGGDGGSISTADTTVLIAGGAGGLESVAINGTDGLDGDTAPNVLIGGSGGGGGGGQSVGLVAGNGGDGGYPGGGGGGGGGSLNGTASGSGGDGADGKLIVIEYLSAGGAATSFVADAGSAAPAAGVINILGAGSTTTSGAGNTITITTPNIPAAVASNFIWTARATLADLSGVTYTTPYRLGRTTSEAFSQWVAPAGGTFDNFYINILAGRNDSTIDVTLTVRVNGVDTALAITIPASTDGTFSNLADVAAFNAGDLLSLSSTAAATGELSDGTVSMRFLPS